MRGKAGKEGMTLSGCTERSQAGALAFVTDGAVFGFVILHGHFEHIIAPYADAMNLG